MAFSTPMRCLVVAATTALCFVVLELGLRVAAPPPDGTPLLADFRTYVANRTAPVGSYLRVPDLGWVPKPGLRYEIGGCEHAFDERGFRSNGDAALADAKVEVAAVGDSFTFGHRLDDRETWPAALERKLGVRVLNAGVSGYGLDQMLVQTKKVLDAFPGTRTVLVALISDDVDRIRYSVRAGIAKPYFRLDGRDALELVPADPEALPGEDDSDVLKWVLGHSWVAHRVMVRAFPEYWNRGTWHHYREAGIDVVAVGRRLVDAFEDEISGRPGTDLVFVLLPASPDDLALVTPGSGAAAVVGAHIAEVAGRAPRVHVADLQSELARRFPDEAERRRLYHDARVDPAGHYDARGAAEVAGIVASLLDANGAVNEGAIDRYALR